jgi:hypothetical protein
MIGLSPPLRHRAVVQRDRQAGRDSWNNPDTPIRETLHAALPCDYWVTGERETIGPNVNVVVEDSRMLVAKTADVVVGDIVTEITNRRGQVLASGSLRVVADLMMEPSHRELALEYQSGSYTEPEPSGGS